MEDKEFEEQIKKMKFYIKDKTMAHTDQEGILSAVDRIESLTREEMEQKHQTTQKAFEQKTKIGDVYGERIVKLEAENRLLKTEMEDNAKAMHGLMNENRALKEGIGKVAEQLEKNCPCGIHGDSGKGWLEEEKESWCENYKLAKQLRQLLNENKVEP